MSFTTIELPEEIKDKHVKSVKLTATKITIEFFDTNVGIILVAIGDCCSSSDFKFNNETFMSTILNSCIDEIIVGEDVSGGDNDGDVIKISPVTIITTDGNVNFELINSSNGYYSGWIEIKKIFTNN